MSKSVASSVVRSVAMAVSSPVGGLTYELSDRAIDLGNLTAFSIPDLSGNALTATQESGIYVSTNGTTDKGINVVVPGADYLTGFIRSSTTGYKYIKLGTRKHRVNVTVANVWQGFISEVASLTPVSGDEIALGWDGDTTFSSADWSDVRAYDFRGGFGSFDPELDTLVSHWKLYDSAAADLDGYPALDSVGGFHGAHVGCAGGSGEPGILQTAGEDFNVDTTTYAGKTVFVPESTIAGIDALGNPITNPRLNERVLNLTTGTGYAEIADSDSLDGYTDATWEAWLERPSIGVNFPIINKAVSTSNFAWNLYHNSGPGTFTLDTTSGGTTATRVISTFNWAAANIPEGEVGQLVAVKTGTTVEWYWNGVLRETDVGGAVATIANVTSPVYIGQYIGGIFANNQLGDIRIYNKSLTPDEVLKNYNARKSAYGL